MISNSWGIGDRDSLGCVCVVSEGVSLSVGSVVRFIVIFVVRALACVKVRYGLGLEW